VHKLPIKIHFLFLLLLTAAISQSCRDDDSLDQVPVVPVDILLAIDLPLYAPLQNPGGWVYLNGGSEGIVVYRISATDFSAFDRHCTFQVANRCRTHIDENTNLTMVDYDCCESVFNLFDGTPLSGPARRPLRRYQTIFNVNNNTLRIY
jgi:nitrite reductase/ring-hydroxylating ferredoxin subunit